MKIFRALVPIPTLLAAFTLAAVVQAQPVQDEQVDIAITGQVTAVDARAKTISVTGANGESDVFKIDEKKTTIMSGSQKVGFTSLHKGEWIAIDANEQAGQKIATYVEVVQDPDPESTPSPALPTAGGATVDVGQDKLAPSLVQIGAGQSVTFQNVDATGVRTVMGTDGSFSSPPLAKGQSWSHSFDVPGVYTVHIKEHPAANANIVVE